jgi:histidinol-phosphate aminotransferase
MNRYPDMACAELYDALSARLDVPVERLAAGTGSVAVLYHLLQAFCESGDEVVYAWRSFEAYPIITRVCTAEPVTVPLDPDHRHDPKAMLAAITPRTRLLFVCNPNNPTGTVLHRDELVEMLDLVPPHVLVVLDEAYREFVTDERVPDGLSLLPDRPNLVVLRTFSKAYRLAGLRVGYAVGAPAVIEALRKVYPAFSVNSLAQAAASAALDCLPELLATCEDVARERVRVLAALRDLGYRVPESQANFVWLPLEDRAVDFAAHCERSGVIVRPFAGDGVRVTVAGTDENNTFLAAARKFVL